MGGPAALLRLRPSEGDEGADEAFRLRCFASGMKGVAVALKLKFLSGDEGADCTRAVGLAPGK